ncbi:hypothetical protein AALO_G00011670 [Alosa alosa]|uniref:HAT C-terminal dimerisation domain-containing protein n=1 Tax=Alosa alosa TaxID=278164 RepID=A0AAV6HFN4_9TELE|nr:hypothetical protein AALO_G00011670 [Alosa alosa]
MVAAHPKHPEILAFIENVSKAYITCGKYMQVKLPLKSKTLQALSSIDPVVRGHSQAVTQLKELANILKHLVPTECDPSLDILRYNVDPNLPNYQDGDDIVKWWAHVFRLEKYPALTQVVRGALSIFHGPLVEASFSLMGDVMRIATFNAVQTVKYTLRSRGRTGITMFKREDVKLGPVDKTVCRNIRAAGKKDKSLRGKRIEEKKKRQADYGSRASCRSAERAKTTAQAEEKQEWPRHVAKQKNAARRKALETLAIAKKKKK